jgi:tRNA U38,U39,U40 pseudouridine synthase TruA
MLEMKNIMKLLRSTVVSLDTNDKGSVMEKSFNMKKRKQNKSHNTNKKKSTTNQTNDNNHEQSDDLQTSTSNEGPSSADANLINTSETTTTNEPTNPSKKNRNDQNVLKRKRFHNFSEKMMAHDYLAYRRLDRLYHRATLKLPSSQNDEKASCDITVSSTFVVISISGDVFLTGQAQRVVGVFLALVNKLIDPEFVDCVFDEEYLHLVPTPPAPRIGVVAAEAHYANQEGKTKRILSARVSDRYTTGWNQECTLRRVKSWQQAVYNHIAGEWKLQNRDDKTGRLKLEKEWTENHLQSWAEKARLHLDEYRSWKKNRSEQLNGAPRDEAKLDNCLSSPAVSVIDNHVPILFEKVLHCLVSA